MACPSVREDGRQTASMRSFVTEPRHCPSHRGDQTSDMSKVEFPPASRGASYSRIFSKLLTRRAGPLPPSLQEMDSFDMDSGSTFQCSADLGSPSRKQAAKGFSDDEREEDSLKDSDYCDRFRCYYCGDVNQSGRLTVCQRMSSVSGGLHHACVDCEWLAQEPKLPSADA
eukprot:5402578-Pleurochrysis_carterae.AAC.2